MDRSADFTFNMDEVILVFWDGLKGIPLPPRYFDQPSKACRDKISFVLRAVVPSSMIALGGVGAMLKLLRMLADHPRHDWMDSMIGIVASLVVVIAFSFASIWQFHRISWWHVIYRTIGMNNIYRVFSLQVGKGDVLHLVQNSKSLRIPGRPTMFRNSMLEPRVSKY
jgi:hypothetical protein